MSDINARLGNKRIGMNNPGKFDCYENAHSDEPMFVLLGRDPMAGSLVRVWVDMREQRGELPEKLEEARRCADALDAWARPLGKEPIDLVILPKGE